MGFTIRIYYQDLLSGFTIAVFAPLIPCPVNLDPIIRIKKFVRVMCHEYVSPGLGSQRGEIRF